MPEQGSSELRLDVQAGRIAYAMLAPELDDDLVNQVIDMAELGANINRAYLAMQIRAQARSYLNGEVISGRYLSVSEGRKELRKLDRLFERIEKTLDALSIEQSLVLDARIKKARNDAQSGLIAAQRQLETLRAAVVDTVEVFKPKTGNPELSRLEQIVGTLMLLFEMETGKRASVSMTKDGEHAPRATSPQAKAVVHLLTEIDPSLDASTVITKIHKLCREQRGKTLNRFALCLWVPMQKVRPIPAKV